MLHMYFSPFIYILVPSKFVQQMTLLDYIPEVPSSNLAWIPTALTDAVRVSPRSLHVA
jgi:hypothetical protein